MSYTHADTGIKLATCFRQSNARLVRLHDYGQDYGQREYAFDRHKSLAAVECTGGHAYLLHRSSSAGVSVLLLQIRAERLLAVQL